MLFIPTNISIQREEILYIEILDWVLPDLVKFYFNSGSIFSYFDNLYRQNKLFQDVLEGCHF